MKLVKIAFLLFALLCLPVFLVQAAPDCVTLNSRWKNLYHKRFKIAWTLKEFNCPSQISKIAEVFYYLENIKYKSNDGVKAPDFWNFVVQGLKKVQYVPKNSTYEWAAASEKGGVITLHDGWMNINDVMSRLEIFVHEAQHIRRNDPGHVDCVRGASKGKNACDFKFFPQQWSGSGYNYGFKYLWWLRDTSSNHELDRKAASLKMEWMVNNRFNKITNEEIKQFTNK